MNDAPHGPLARQAGRPASLEMEFDDACPEQGSQPRVASATCFFGNSFVLQPLVHEVPHARWILVTEGQHARSRSRSVTPASGGIAKTIATHSSGTTLSKAPRLRTVVELPIDN
ncbi:hypothetical protein VTI74DRAFT_4616 [Chaetomium olivicolor]